MTKTNPPLDGKDELREWIKSKIDPKTGMIAVSYAELVDRIEALLQSQKHQLLEGQDRAIMAARKETEKAFGGCKKCYGKGYATVIEYASGFDTDQDIGSPGGAVRYKQDVMRYCSCDRGKQLQQLRTSQGETHD